MIALKIIGGLLLLLAFLLVMPIGVRLSCWNGHWNAQVQYIFIRYGVSPELLARRAEKTAKREVKKKRPAKKPKEKKPEEEEAKKEGPLASLGALQELWRSSRKRLAVLRRHVVIDRLQVAVEAGGEDAHKTALLYARLAAAAAVALEILGELFELKKPRVSILPDFCRPGIRYDVSLRVRVRPFILLLAGTHLLIVYLRLIKPKYQNAKIKGGSQHEPATSH